MDLASAEPFLTANHRAALLTLKRDGRPQSSNIAYSWYDGAAHISVTADRAKTRNLARDPRASLHVVSDNWYQYVVVESNAELLPVTSEPGDATGLALRAQYEATNGGPHPDWDEYDRAMVTDGRLVIILRPTHIYGMLPN